MDLNASVDIFFFFKIDVNFPMVIATYSTAGDMFLSIAPRRVSPLQIRAEIATF